MTWKMNKGDDNLDYVFNNKCLRRILCVRWQDHIMTEDLLKRAEMKPLSEEVKIRRCKMIGHILRHNRESDGNVLMTWAMEGKRRRGRPRTTWRRTVEKERRDGGWGSWDEVRVAAAGREKWKGSVKALCAKRHLEDR